MRPELGQSRISVEGRTKLTDEVLLTSRYLPPQAPDLGQGTAK